MPPRSNQRTPASFAERSARHRRSWPALHCRPTSVSVPTRYSAHSPYRTTKAEPSASPWREQHQAIIFPWLGKSSCTAARSSGVTDVEKPRRLRKWRYSAKNPLKPLSLSAILTVKLSRSALLRLFRHFGASLPLRTSTEEPRSTIAEVHPPAPAGRNPAGRRSSPSALVAGSAGAIRK